MRVRGVRCETLRSLPSSERKCADTTATVLFPGLAISSAKIYLYFFKYNIRKQFYQTALGNCYGLKLPKC